MPTQTKTTNFVQTQHNEIIHFAMSTIEKFENLFISFWPIRLVAEPRQLNSHNPSTHCSCWEQLKTKSIRMQAAGRLRTPLNGAQKNINTDS